MKMQKNIILFMLLACGIFASAQQEALHSRSLPYKGTWGVRILNPTAYDKSITPNAAVNAENFDLDFFLSQIDQLTTINHVMINIHRGHQASWYSSPYPEMAAVMGSDLFPERDLFGETVDALKARGLKVLVYFSITAMDPGYLTTSQISTWNSYRASEGLTRNQGAARIIEYYSLKFGTKIDGWWIDRVTNSNLHSAEDKLLYATACRAGNPNAMVTMNTKVGPPLIQGTIHDDYTAGHPVTMVTQVPWDDGIGAENSTIIENIEAGPYINTSANPDDSEGTALGAFFIPIQEKWRDGNAGFPTPQATEWTIRTMAAGGMYTWAVARINSGFAIPQFNQLVEINASVDAYLNDTTGDVTGISISPNSTNLLLNSTIQITTNVIPFYANNSNVNWSSSDDSIATVDENGLVTAGATQGTVTITATTEDGGFTDTCVVTVVPPTSGDNLALYGTATQSTTLNGAEASRAIDDNTDGIFSRGSVTAAEGPDAWWQVELDNSYSINTINVFNRTNCCEERLADFTVSVINSDGLTVYEETITTIPDPSVTIYAGGAVGNIVRIDSNLTLTLNLAEVQVFGNTLGIEENTKNDRLRIYPNPVSDIINIDFKSSETAKMQIIDYLGKTIQSSNIKNGANTIDLSGLSSGLYIMKVSDKYETFTSKIIKK